MVRQVVGILVEIGRGNLTQSKLKYFLQVKTNEPAQYTAPPSGLFLEHVYYKGDTISEQIHATMTINSSFRKWNHES
jgi:tRNA pseudouridine38-40 synthase